MKVESPGTVSGVGDGRHGHGRGTLRAPSQQDEGAHGDIKDEVSLFGIPQDELTPKVRAALSRLLDDIKVLRRELDASMGRIAELERLADYDSLTPVYNRRAFERELARLISFADRHHAPLSLIYFDVDGLKRINDRHGHPMGDAALLAITGALAEGTRESDLLGRLGGDEFGVILPHTGEQKAQETAARLTRAVSEIALPSESGPVTVSVTYGVHLVGPGESADEALAAADIRMYAHKQHSATGG